MLLTENILHDMVQRFNEVYVSPQYTCRKYKCMWKYTMFKKNKQNKTPDLKYKGLKVIVLKRLKVIILKRRCLSTRTL